MKHELLSSNENLSKRYEYFSILYRDTKCFASDEQDAKILNVLNDLELRTNNSYITYQADIFGESECNSSSLGMVSNFMLFSMLSFQFL